MAPLIGTRSNSIRMAATLRLTLGEPTGPVQEFIQWILSTKGQRIVEQQGYIPVYELPPADAPAGDQPTP